MNIHGAIIRSDEIIGISQLYENSNGTDFHLCFSVITKSTAVEFCSDLVKDAHVATKAELASLQEFRLKYHDTRASIAILLGESQAIFDEFQRTIKINDDYYQFNLTTDKIAAILKKLKSKQTEQLTQLLGEAWALTKTIKENSK